MNGIFKNIFCWSFIAFLLFSVAGCGSSGSSSSDAEEEKTYTLTAVLCDYDSGEEVTTLFQSVPRKLKISVEDPYGQAAEDILVHASFVNAKGEFVDTEDGTALTDEQGLAEMVVISAQERSGTDAIQVTMEAPAGSDAAVTEVEIPFEIDLSGQGSGTIEFVSADPNMIGLLGTTSESTLPSQSSVVFKVKDQWGNPVYNETVSFSLTSDTGGITITPETAVTNYQGNVTVVVKSGYVPASVRVRADVESSDIYTLSGELILSTGFPDQDSFSVSVDTFNPNAFNYDGEEVAVTVRAADRNNNPCPQGTAVYFTAEAGSIDSSGFTDATGACSVTWRSQGVRPDDGRVTILAYAVGEESFQDRNSTGLYENEDVDTLTTDMPEAFLDVNENNGFDELIETYVDFNNDGLYTEADGKYNGTLCGGGVDDCAGELIHVREDIVIVMSDDRTAYIQTSPAELSFSSSAETKSIVITIADSNGNSMPEGTSVELTAPENCEIAGDTSFTVPNTTGPYVLTAVLSPKEGEDVQASDTFIIEVTSPTDYVTSKYVTVTIMAETIPDIETSPSEINFSNLTEEKSVSIMISDNNGESLPEGTSVEFTAPENCNIDDVVLLVPDEPYDFEDSNTYTITNTNDPCTFEATLSPKAGSEQKTDNFIITVITPDGKEFPETIEVTIP